MQYKFQGEFEKPLIVLHKNAEIIFRFYEFAIEDRILYIVKMPSPELVQQYGEFIPFMTTIFPFDHYPKPAIADRFGDDDLVNSISAALQKYLVNKHEGG